MNVRVRVTGFARVREILGESKEAEVPSPAFARDLWTLLCRDHPDLCALSASTRIARNGELVSPETPLIEGDEIALLPPVGGG